MKSLDEIVKEICDKDGRYASEAYFFIYEALDYTLNTLNCEGHISGQQLMEGVRQLAVNRFSMMALTVFNEWGVKTTMDFGNIVFHLVEENALGKTEHDDLNDFNELFDFDIVFGDMEKFKSQWKIKD